MVVAFLPVSRTLQRKPVFSNLRQTIIFDCIIQSYWRAPIASSRVVRLLDTRLDTPVYSSGGLPQPAYPNTLFLAHSSSICKLARSGIRMDKFIYLLVTERDPTTSHSLIGGIRVNGSWCSPRDCT
ncbi:hypothetical protein OIDMADRAFT_16083 [Oidiodendron maius Zn]|uniref:Uncharacterized protein n=1 Tax=Oidiodendron maius (strain Zn) TaxID=913774 RepID=A0A0C3D7K0_OIDMZ|nr:hypothetical protein OIDMADRAFT_16083 [Oidiodendron maius Zn]